MRPALKWIAICCFLLSASASERRGRIDLKALARNPDAFQRMSLMWEYPPNAALYVYGDGRLRLQVYPVVSDDPDDPFVMRNRSGFVPTCQAKINIDEIKSLVDLMIERHFSTCLRRAMSTPRWPSKGGRLSYTRLRSTTGVRKPVAHSALGNIKGETNRCRPIS